MIDKRKRKLCGNIGGGFARRTPPEETGELVARRARRLPWSGDPVPNIPLDAKARALIIVLLLAMTLCGVSGLVGSRASTAFAAEGYTHTFPNGNSVQVHSDGAVTGTCVMTNNATVNGVFGGTVTMPDGSSYHAACYERYLGVPNFKYYPGPCDGTYPFRATRNEDGTYFVVIQSQDADHGAPGAGESDKYPYQRCYTKEWALVLDIEVSFLKRSADISITEGNSEYSLAGASFDIYDAATDTKVSTITMDETGRASCRLAPNRKYYAIETKAPAGYILHHGRIPFSTGTQASEIPFDNRPGSVSLTLRKRDAATEGGPQAGLTLKGAKYEISSLSTPGWKTTATTDERGIATAEGVPLGRIAVTEVEAPAGYKIDSTVHVYEVNGGQLGDAGTFELNPQDGYAEIPCAFDIELVKYLESGGDSSGLQNPGAGVRFSIISNSTGKAIGTIKTDEHGRASTAGMWFGEGKRVDGVRGAIPHDAKGYTVREDPDSTPEGYQPCPEWTIGTEQMVDGATLHYIVDNDFIGSRIQIIKHDAASGRPVPLAGFSFQVLDEEKRPVTQEAWHPNHVVLDEFTTDETGSVTLPEILKPGTYYIRETSAVPPYLINGDDIEFKIADASTTEPITVARIADDRARGTATIIKRCSEDDCPWGDEDGRLKGAVFNVIALEDILSPDGTVEAVKDEVVGTVTTGDDGTGRIDGLPLGGGSARYAFVETSPAAGHLLDPAPIPFTLTWEDAGTATVHASVETDNAPTEVVVDKTDASTNKPLEGAVFDVWPRQLEHAPIDSTDGLGTLLITNRSGKRNWDGVDISLTEGSSETGEKDQPTRYTARDFALDGDVAMLTGIEAGEYVLAIPQNDRKAKTPTLHVAVTPGECVHAQWRDEGLLLVGHTLAPGYRRVIDSALARLDISTISDDQGHMRLAHLPATVGELSRLIKIDEGSDRKPEKPVEGEGTPDVSEDTPLTWRIQETEAPAGYVADPTVHDLDIQTKKDGQDDSSQRVSIENDFTKVEIAKRSTANEEPLEGAKLELADAEGNIVDRWTSSSEPHRIDRIAPGAYVLTEIAPPQTHDQAERLSIDVKPTTAVQTFAMYDEELSIEGGIDKRQEIVEPTASGTRANGDGLNRVEPTIGDDGCFSYSLDYRNESSSWVDEFTVDDHLSAVEAGMAELTSVTTGRAHGDLDGRLNLWYRTNLDDGNADEHADANATISDGHENPWLGDPAIIEAIGNDGRVLDYKGWRLWASDVPAEEITTFDVADLDLAPDERVTAIRLEYGSVSKGFTTRHGEWDDARVKDLHDDWNPLPLVHPKPDADEPDAAPTVLNMKALETYQGGCSIDNHASVSLYRNGGGDSLEAHDEDMVHQEAARPAMPFLDQTGSNPFVRSAIALVILGGATTGFLKVRNGKKGTVPKGAVGLRGRNGSGRGAFSGRGRMAQ